MAISKETYKKAYDLLKKTDKVLLCINNRSSYDTHLAAAALYLYLKDLGKNVTVCVDKYMKDRPKRVFDSMKISFDTELLPLRYIVSIDHKKGELESVRYDDVNGTFNLYITPTKMKGSFDFKNVKFSGGGEYGVVIVMGAQKLEHLGEVYYKNKEFFDGVKIISINNLVSKAIGKVSLTSSEVPVSEIVYNLISDSFSSPSINKIIKLLLTGIINEIQLFNKSDYKISTVEAMTSLVKLGGDVKEVLREIYFQKNQNVISVIKNVMENIMMDSTSRIIWSKVDYSNFVGSGSKKSDLVLDGFVPFNISKDYDIAFVLYEVGKGEIWVELESNVELIDAKSVLSSYRPSGNTCRAVAVIKNMGLGQAESLILSRLQMMKVTPVPEPEEPKNEDILTKKDKSGHNSQAFSDQGLITPPPLSPA